MGGILTVLRPGGGQCALSSGSWACGYPLALAAIYPPHLFTPVNRSSDCKTWACLQKGQQHPWIYKWPLGWQQCDLEVWGLPLIQAHECVRAAPVGLEAWARPSASGVGGLGGAGTGFQGQPHFSTPGTRGLGPSKRAGSLSGPRQGYTE